MISIVNGKIQKEEKEMRGAFAEVMNQLVEEDSRVIYLDADLMNSVAMTQFAKKYPSNAINCGVQEANMIGTAAGLSATGMIPYAHTFATFASRRVMDQVFISGAYAKLNVKIIGSDAGVAAEYNGGTHMPFEDIATMRCIPEMTIIEPTDSTMLKDIITQTKDLFGMYYIRIIRKNAQKIYEEGSKFKIGKGVILREGADITLIASGIMVAEAMNAAKDLAEIGISARVVDMHTIKPIDKELLIESAKKTGAIVTIENHNIIGGLGSAVAEVLSENNPTYLKRIGINDLFGEVGTLDYLKETFGLTKENIVVKSKELVEKKKRQKQS